MDEDAILEIEYTYVDAIGHGKMHGNGSVDVSAALDFQDEYDDVYVDVKQGKSAIGVIYSREEPRDNNTPPLPGNHPPSQYDMVSETEGHPSSSCLNGNYVLITRNKSNLL